MDNEQFAKRFWFAMGASLVPSMLVFVGGLIYFADQGSQLAGAVLVAILVMFCVVFVALIYVAIIYAHSKMQESAMAKQARIDNEKFVNNAKENLLIAKMAADTTRAHADAQRSQIRTAQQGGGQAREEFLSIPDSIEGMISD